MYLKPCKGKAAGVDIRTSDRPGEVGDIFIRGSRSLSASSQPLYVVDGVPLNGTVGKTHEENLDNVSPRGGTLESLNPSDIESVEVLKDASATAIYGSRGANGVILITTKRGKEGKFTFSYAGSVSTDNIKDRTTWMSAGDYLTWRRWAIIIPIQTNIRVAMNRPLKMTNKYSTQPVIHMPGQILNVDGLAILGTVQKYKPQTGPIM